jgi:hypothetical protein
MDRPQLNSGSLDDVIRQADADLEAGRFATHAEVSDWLDRWTEPGGPGPAPRPWLDQRR